MTGGGGASEIFSRAETFLGGWSFAAFLLFALLYSEFFLVVLMVLPSAAGPLGAFASEFRTWCLGADPATGHPQWAYVAMYVLNPLMVAAVIWGVWSGPLREALSRGPRVFTAPALGALVPVVFSSVALFLYRSPAAVALPPFPADALRVEIPAPSFELIDQENRPFALADAKARVALVTAVYSSCGTACPRMLAEVREALGELSPEVRSQLDVIAITLDPARDRPEKMRDFARAYGLGDGRAGHERVHFLTGDPVTVNRVLDSFDFTRKRDTATGAIDHAPIFLLVDRRGNIAYRFALGESQKRWMPEALRILAAEAAG